MKKYHLLKDIGIYKSSLKTSFYRWYGDRTRESDINEVKELIERRGQVYTIDEIEKMIGCYASSHHECVVDEWQGDPAYQTRRGAPSIEVYTAQKHLEREAKLFDLIKRLRSEERKEAAFHAYMQAATESAEEYSSDSEGRWM